MYLEISGRVTGKSTRMIKAFLHHPAENKRIVCCTHRMAMQVAMEYGIDNRFIICAEQVKYGGYLGQYILFWDNFDSLPTSFNGERYIKKGDYYSTTPSFLRGPEDFQKWMNGKPDMLLTLIHKCNHKYKHFSWGSHPGLDDAKHSMCKGQQLAQIKGKFECTFKDFTEGMNK